ncbi:MAG TPA: hypothetical protein DIT85_00370 [Pantoea ananatis]|nr:hypothetical protein [Pantoea ananatis]
MNLYVQTAEVIDKNLAMNDDFKAKALLLANFLNEHPRSKLYTLSKIKKISNSDDHMSLQLALFFCGERLQLLSPRYAYIEHDGSEIYLTKSDFKKCLHITNKTYNDSFITEDGSRIEHFKQSNLNLYFVKKEIYEDIEIMDLD